MSAEWAIGGAMILALPTLIVCTIALVEALALVLIRRRQAAARARKLPNREP